VLQSREIVASTVFQMTLYYNVWFSLLYFGLSCLVVRWKTYAASGWRAEFLSPAMFGIWACTEIGRLYLGYAGNLREEVPQLAAFFFLSVFPQAVFQIWFLFLQDPLLPLDRIVSAIMCVFLGLEMIIGWSVTRRIIRSKTARFAVEYGAQDAELQQRAAASRARGHGAGVTGVPLVSATAPGVDTTAMAATAATTTAAASMLQRRAGRRGSNDSGAQVSANVELTQLRR
jgi:transmembrane protein 17